MRGYSACLPSDNTRLTESASQAGRSRVVSSEGRRQNAENPAGAPESGPSTRVNGKQISAFAQFVHPFERAIYLAALAFVYDPDEAVAVAQESVLRAFKSSLPEAATAGQLKSWLVAIVIDEAKAFLREKKQVDCDDIAGEDGPDILDLVRHPSAQLGHIPCGASTMQQTRGMLGEAVGRLPRKIRVVLFLRDVLGLTTSETAQQLGISEETIRKRLACARFGVSTALHGASWSQPVTFARPLST